MSRSLGDITAHQVGVTAKPERVSYALKPEDMFVVFASDGIWQVMEDQEVRAPPTAPCLQRPPSASGESLRTSS